MLANLSRSGMTAYLHGTLKDKVETAMSHPPNLPLPQRSGYLKIRSILEICEGVVMGDYF